ncbi:MAG: hypothetical protein GY755_23600 [Chloroflexi bacterium]|nr:hypothetical protein [Chloroflexota bacterium]
MGILSDIFRVDKVKDVLAAISSDDDYTGYNVLISSALFSSFRNVETISATKELTDGDYQIQLITPSGADRTVELPPEAVTNHPHLIACAAGASYDVVVKDDAGATTYATLEAGESGLFVSDGASWSKIGGSATVEGTAVLSTGEAGGTKFLREDGDGTCSWQAASGGTSALPLGYFYGYSLSIDTDTDHDILIAAGSARDSTNAEDIIGTALTKQIDAAWSAGDDAGGMDTGSVTTDTWYHVFAILKDSDDSVDYLFSLSSTSPTMPSGYTYFRLLGSVLTDGSSNLLGFTQVGNHVVWDLWVKDADSTIGTTSTLITMSTPDAYETFAQFNLQTSASNTDGVLTTSPQKTDETQSTSSYNAYPADVVSNQGNRQSKALLTDSSGRIRVSASAAAQAYAIWTVGWQYVRENM